MRNFLERFVSVMTPDELTYLTDILLLRTCEAEMIGLSKAVLTVKFEFDFESVYKIYPRKLGKASGIRKLKSKVKTDEKYEQLKLAVEKYAAHCKRERIEEKFIMHFNTWCSRWEDWVPSATEKPKELTPDFAGIFKK